MRALAPVLALLLVSAPLARGSAAVTEPVTGVAFDSTAGRMSLLGVGLRTKTFLKFRVYAIGFYVADEALSGPLAAHKANPRCTAFYDDLIWGDFEKQIVLKLVRDLSAEQIQGSFRSHMPQADGRLLAQFVSYFPKTAAGQDAVIHWVPGRGLETTVGGVVYPLIADKAFAAEVFAIWLRDRPAEDPLRRQLVSRAGLLLN